MTGDSFMATGIARPGAWTTGNASVAKIIRNGPEPMEVADAGHFVQEWGAPIAKAALEKFGI
ncbi:hypothetical protein MNBD_ALPHA05-1136 [hydrothermal vent metagenome]|uniref:Haloalkane dehalogenase n=1 Tax=hydrothermal vent metagenome TaxID=652676 RepID=A0A3B0T580_9ZZZZ